MQSLPVRLKPGADLRKALEGLGPAQSGWFVVAGIGSLAKVRLRMAAEEHETAMNEPVEILTLAGTVTTDGAHLHMSVADAHGRVLGGHVAYGNEVRTTVELLLVECVGWSLGREMDSATGYKELVVRKPSQGTGGESAA